MTGKCLFFLILLMLVSVACTHTRKTIASKGLPEEKLHVSSDEQGKIAFLLFEVKLTDSVSDNYSFRLKNTIFADGILKSSDFREEPTVEKNNFYCQLSNDKGEASNWIIVKDPLNMVYEHPGEKGSDLGKTLFKANSGEFNIRFQWNPAFKYLNIYKSDRMFKLKKVYYAAF